MSTEDRIENVNPEVEAEEVSEEVLSEQRQIRREKLKAPPSGRRPWTRRALSWRELMKRAFCRR